jgi:translation elongation factor EF-1alpha
MLPLYFDCLLGGHGLYISLFFFYLCGRQAIVKVVTVYQDIDEVDYAMPGENLRIRLSGVEEEDISPGFVLSSVSEYSIYHPSLVKNWVCFQSPFLVALKFHPFS